MECASKKSQLRDNCLCENCSERFLTFLGLIDEGDESAESDASIESLSDENESEMDL